MRLPDEAYRLVNSRANIYYATRETTKFWNEQRGIGDLPYFTGYYWYEHVNNRAVSGEQHGPFKSYSAAYRNAFQYFEMRLAQPLARLAPPSPTLALPAPKAAHAAPVVSRQSQKAITPALKKREAVKPAASTKSSSSPKVEATLKPKKAVEEVRRTARIPRWKMKQQRRQSA